MIAENNQIAYRNVASKYYNFLPEDIDDVIKDFDMSLSKFGFNTNGIVFLSLISEPTEEVMTAEIFLSIDEGHFTVPKDENIKFSSYFFIDQMLMTRVIEDIEVVSQVKYWELLEYIKKHELTKKTPMFMEFKRSQLGQSYVEMSVGV